VEGVRLMWPQNVPPRRDDARPVKWTWYFWLVFGLVLYGLAFWFDLPDWIYELTH